MITKVRLVRFGKIFLIPLVFLFACGEKGTTDLSSSTKKVESDLPRVNADAVILIPEKGLVLYQDQPFTGTSVDYYPNGNKSVSIDYKEGKRQGFYRKWFENGVISYESHYETGKQDGVARTWWQSNILRSESNYKNGIVEGIQTQWYKSGAKFKEQNIVNGKEEGIQRAWRENGKIYNNYEAKNGRIFGLKRSTLCYELDDENLRLKNK